MNKPLEYSNYTENELINYFEPLLNSIQGVNKNNIINFIGKWGETEYGKSEEYKKSKLELININKEENQYKLKDIEYSYALYNKSTLLTTSIFYDNEYDMLINLKSNLDKKGYYNVYIVQYQKFVTNNKTNIVAIKIL